jgi:hypothetical protein
LIGSRGKSYKIQNDIGRQHGTWGLLSEGRGLEHILMRIALRFILLQILFWFNFLGASWGLVFGGFRDYCSNFNQKVAVILELLIEYWLAAK